MIVDSDCSVFYNFSRQDGEVKNISAPNPTTYH